MAPICSVDRYKISEEFGAFSSEEKNEYFLL
jgi:hypothetical protein